MASSAERLLLVSLLAACAAGGAACSVGKGSGVITGTVTAPECGIDGAYSLEPDFFVAEAIDHSTEVRIQRGSDWEVYSDGLILFVRDATMVSQMGLGTPQPAGDADLTDDVEPQLQITFYLNETCRVETRRDDTPVALAATGGTVTFDSIYAPQVDEDDVETIGHLNAVTFEATGSPSPRTATLSGDFTFLYNRGRPAQRFP